MVPFYRNIDLIATIAAKANSWTKKETFLGRLGTLNSILWAIAKRTGFLRRKDEGWDVDYAKLARFKNSKAIQISIKWMGLNINVQGWVSNQAEAGRKMAERCLNWLWELNLWGDRQHMNRGKKSTAAEHEGFNVVLLLLVYEAIERVFVGRYGMDALPRHKGATVPMLYNAVFKGYRQYNRQQDTETLLPTETPMEVEALEERQELLCDRIQNIYSWLCLIGSYQNFFESYLFWLQLRERCLKPRRVKAYTKAVLELAELMRSDIRPTLEWMMTTDLGARLCKLYLHFNYRAKQEVKEVWSLAG